MMTNEHPVGDCLRGPKPRMRFVTLDPTEPVGPIGPVGPVGPATVLGGPVGPRISFVFFVNATIDRINAVNTNTSILKEKNIILIIIHLSLS